MDSSAKTYLASLEGFGRQLDSNSIRPQTDTENSQARDVKQTCTETENSNGK